jgi:hypothetical protein
MRVDGLMPLVWPKLRHFRPAEFGDANVCARLDQELLLTLDALRGLVGVPIVIHTGAITAPRAETSDSQHPNGRAVDCSAPTLPLLEFWLYAERFPTFRGIGLYPFWQRPGLHLDTRPTTVRARWWRDVSGRYAEVTPAVLAALAETP